MNKPQLTDKDLYCIARIIQGSLFESLTFGCRYCKYKANAECRISDGHKWIKEWHLDVIRKKLEAITGVDLGILYDPEDPDSKFAHK